MANQKSVALPTDGGAAAAGAAILPPRADREPRPAVVDHAAREEHVEPLHEVLEGHPELALVPDPHGKQLLVTLSKRVPLPRPLAPRTVPLS